MATGPERRQSPLPGRQQRRIVGVGQKMYLSYQETRGWLEDLRTRAPEFADVDLFVLPTFPALGSAQTLLTDSGILWGAQDVHWQDRGAFTGEVSPLTLVELGCTLVEIGHAERRSLFGETDEIVRLKTSAAIAHHLVPLICVGEEMPMNADEAAAYVRHQVCAALPSPPSSVPQHSGPPVMIAYEPIWAIGKAESAPANYVRTVLKGVREMLDSLGYGRQAILYGGSVRPGEAARFIDAGADGVFVGRAALDLDNLRAIVRELLFVR